MICFRIKSSVNGLGKTAIVWMGDFRKWGVFAAQCIFHEQFVLKLIFL